MLTKGFVSSLEHWGNVETFGFTCDDVVDDGSLKNRCNNSCFEEYDGLLRLYYAVGSGC